MIQINIGDRASGVDKYDPVPTEFRWQFQWARKQAIWISKNKPLANPYFKALPGGRTLSELLADGSIWINFNSSDADIFGETSDNDISIGRYSVKVGQWTVLGTLIHELAHVDGAPGGYPGQPGAEDKRAEGALVPCGLGYLKELTSGVDDPFTPYTPGISG